ncbi:MAG: hypothetical protein HY961_12670 [Ignavibacteriae bacterium]|nr:hypothetical protein [Ignavibacteriota bacterium]
MFRTHLLMTFVMSVFLCTQLLAQDLDKRYVSTFGWGTAAVSQAKAPAFAEFDASIFHHKDGKFFITAGEDVELHSRFLLKGGKTYAQHLAALKKSLGKKVATHKADYIRTLFYVSHDEAGAQLSTQWPSSINDVPKWKEIGADEINFTPAADWVSSRFTLSEKQADFTSLISWLKKARPGWKLYIVHVAGFTRDAPELKFYDKAELRYKTPLEYIDTEPLAVATVEIEKSSNPMMAWSYKIEKMPAEQKGMKDGIMIVMKDGNKATTFKFGIKYDYLNKVTKLHNFTVHYEYEDGQVIGGFYAQGVSSIELGIQNTFYEAIGRALSAEKLQ